MLKTSEPIAARDRRATQTRRTQMQHLNAIEGNPLTDAEIAMFEMFEREGWSHDRRRAFIFAQSTGPAATPMPAAE